MGDFKCLKDVRERISALASASSPVCLNSHVINASYQFTSTNGKKKTIAFTEIAKHLTQKFCPDATSGPTTINIGFLRVKIQRLLESFNKLVKAVERNSQSISAFLIDEFSFPTCTAPSSAAQSPPRSPVQLQQSECSVISPVKTRRDCSNCSSTKKANISLSQDLKNEKGEVLRLKSFSADLKRSLRIRAKNQRLVRQEKTIRELKETLKKTQSKLKSLELKNKRLLQEKHHLITKAASLESKVRNLKDCNVKLSDMEYNSLVLEEKILELEKCENSKGDSDRPISTVKVGKAYCSNIRRLVYHQLVSDVPVKQCGRLIGIFSKVMCGESLKNCPSHSTCSQMAYELGTITTIQTIQHMLDSGKNICLSWDATTLDGAHVNEIHLTVDKTECLVLDVRHLPGGKTADYVTHIVSALTEAVDVYARFSGTSPEFVFAGLNFTSTLTDRAAVNACVTRQLRLELDTQLIQLNCNVHPLDSIARYAKQGLCEVDKSHGVTGNCYGKEGTAVNIINAVSVLRFKDGSGDPMGFKNMLHFHNLPVGTFVRYVGNRLHVVFHLAGILVLHYSKVKEFIKRQCTAGGLLRSALSKDLSNEKIMAQVWALGVVGKIFTGPWMTMFYSSNLSNLEMRPFVQSSERQLKAWIQMPQSLLQPTMNVFGETLSPDKDDVLSALNNFVSGEVEIQVDALSSLTKSCLTVLQRQLKAFLSEEEFTPEDIKKVSSAPTHNMASERALGCYDKMYRRAPVASGGFLSGKVRSKLNKSTQWLDGLSADMQSRVISFAIKEAKEDRVRKSVLDKELKTEISRRRQEVACERRQKDKNKIVKLVKKALKENSVMDLDCCNSVKEKMNQFIEGGDSFVGSAFLISVDTSECNGRIVNVEGNDITVGYWNPGQSELSAVDHTISIFSLFADAILGAVIFL